MRKPGTYRLMYDVINPNPDLRFKRDWRAQPVFKCGWLFILDHNPYTPNELQLRAQSSFSTILERDERFLRIYNALSQEPIQEKPTDLLVRQGYKNIAPYVLDRLFLMDAITLEQVEKALELELADPDETQTE